MLKGGEILMAKVTMADMPYHYGIKLRIYPSSQQKKMIKKNSDASRFVYNHLVGVNKEIFQLRKTYLGENQDELKAKATKEYVEYLKKSIKTGKAIKDCYFFLQSKYIDSFTIATAIKSYKASWNMFKKVHGSRAGTPKFHKKSSYERYQTSTSYAGKVEQPSLLNGTVYFTDKHHIRLPKLGIVYCSGMTNKIWNKRELIRMGTISIKKDATDRYTVSLALGCETPFVARVSKTGKKLGIDLNTENFLTDTDGDKVDNPRYYRKSLKRLKKAQRKLSLRAERAKKEHRKLANSKNYQKQRVEVAKISQKVKAQREHFLHELSTAVIKNHDFVVAEELRSSNMLKNHALAMSISDVGWRTFLQQLTYKAEMYDKTFVTVNPKNTTQTCSACGYLMKGEEKLTLRDREWTCTQCGTFHIRDHNAAQNILAKGLEQSK